MEWTSLSELIQFDNLSSNFEHNHSINNMKINAKIEDINFGISPCFVDSLPQFVQVKLSMFIIDTSNVLHQWHLTAWFLWRKMERSD